MYFPPMMSKILPFAVNTLLPYRRYHPAIMLMAYSKQYVLLRLAQDGNQQRNDTQPKAYYDVDTVQLKTAFHLIWIRDFFFASCLIKFAIFYINSGLWCDRSPDTHMHTHSTTVRCPYTTLVCNLSVKSHYATITSDSLEIDTAPPVFSVLF